MTFSEEQIWAYVEGETSPEETAELDAALATDADLARELAIMKEAMALVRDAAAGPRERLVMPESVSLIFQTEPFEWYRPPFTRGLRAAASEDRGAYFKAELEHGSAELDVRVRAPAVLSISWTASFVPSEGWMLALKPDHDQRARTYALPASRTGEWTATAAELGFDPHDVPFEIAWVAR